MKEHIVTNSQVLFHSGSLLHSKFNTQLLITVHNSSRILTQVQLLPVLEHNHKLHSRQVHVLSVCVSEHNSLSASKALLYIAHSHFHSNVSVYIVVLLWKCHKLTVMRQ
jgi:hypothetical protein